MRLTRGDAPGAALRAAALSRAVRRLAKLLGGARTLGAVLTRSGSNELKRARDIDEAWSEVTIEAAASLPAPVGQDELAVIAALIRDRAGGAHPVVLVFALMWQSPERRAQVATHQKLLTALLHRAASFSSDEDAAAVAAMALGELCRTDGGSGACFAPEVLAAYVDEARGGCAIAVLCRIIAARHPNRLLTGSALSAIGDAARTCRSARFEIARQEKLLEGLAWCLETDGGACGGGRGGGGGNGYAHAAAAPPDRGGGVISPDLGGSDLDLDQDEDPLDRGELAWANDVRAAAAWAAEALAREARIAEVAAAVPGLAEGLACAADCAELAAFEAAAALGLIRAAAAAAAARRAPPPPAARCGAPGVAAGGGARGVV